MEHLHIVVAAGAAAYLLGAVPFGFLIARARGVDIRQHGSGNIGATNVFRTLGKPWGVLTMLLDAGKGFVAAYPIPRLATALNSEASLHPSLPVLCACLAVAGHNWPVFLRFRGGKGIATSSGALLGIAPLAAGIGFATWISVLLVSHYVSLASIIAALTIPLSGWWLYAQSGPVLPTALTLLGAAAVWRHRSNLQRLYRGTENRFSFGRRKASS